MLQQNGERRMATTMTALLLRNSEVFVGHVGDCRAYLVHQGRLTRLTADQIGFCTNPGAQGGNQVCAVDLFSWVVA